MKISDANDIYHFPVKRSVAEFQGAMNEFEGAVQNNRGVNIALGALNCIIPNGVTGEVIVAIRPEDISLSREPHDCANEFPAQLVSRLFLGDITLYHLSVNGKKLQGKTAGMALQLEPGSSIYVRLPAEKLKIFPK